MTDLSLTFLGDGLLVYFGYPHAHENDAERAVRAGLDIVTAIPRLETAASAPLKARVGVATGVVVVGDLIAEGASEGQAVVGETPNLAARLQAVAEPGTVVMSASTRRLAAGHFEYRKLGATHLKGLADPIVVWQALGLSAVEGRFEAEHGISLAAAARPARRDRTPFASLATSGARRRLRRSADWRTRHRQVAHRFDVSRTFAVRAAYPAALFLFVASHQQRACSPLSATSNGRRDSSATTRRPSNAPSWKRSSLKPLHTSQFWPIFCRCPKSATACPTSARRSARKQRC